MHEILIAQIGYFELSGIFAFLVPFSDGFVSSVYCMSPNFVLATAVCVLGLDEDLRIALHVFSFHFCVHDN